MRINVSSRIDPVYSAEHRRTVLDVDAQPRHFPLVDYAVQRWREQHCRSDGVPDANDYVGASISFKS